MSTYGTLTADGDTDEVFCEGPFSVIASGTWGGGTLSVQIKSRDGSTWSPLNAPSPMTTDSTGQVTFEIEGGHKIKATLSGSTAPSLAWEFFGSRLTD